MTGPRDDPYAFSFSGLKTAVARYVESNPDFVAADVAAGFQEAVADVLTRKAVRAAGELEVSTLLIAGEWPPTHEFGNWPPSAAPTPV